MAAIQWMAINPNTGLPIAELPGLRCESTLTTLVGATGGTVGVTLPVTDRMPPNWQTATSKGVVFVAQYDDDNETVLWAGIVHAVDLGSAAEIRIELIDAHGYLDRVHQTFHQNFTQWELFDLASFIISRGMSDYRARTSDSSFGGPLTDFDWPADESAFSALVRLTQNHPVEWTLEWRWVTPTIETEWGFTRRLFLSTTFAERVGRRATATVQPYLLSDVDWSKRDDWTAGRGADQIVAIGQSSGDEPTPVEAWPPYRFPDGPMQMVETISVDSTKPSELIAEAKRRHAELSHGTTVYDVSLIVADSDLFLGRHISLGDDVLVDLANPNLPALDHSFEARMVGWTLEPDPQSGQITTLKPILVDREA